MCVCVCVCMCVCANCCDIEISIRTRPKPKLGCCTTEKIRGLGALKLFLFDGDVYEYSCVALVIYRGVILRLRDTER